jgi:hypothetical protein
VTAAIEVQDAGGAAFIATKPLLVRQAVKRASFF